MRKDQKEMESRREFLKTAGKFAVYTPPALMLMSKSSHANFTKSGGGDVNEDETSSGSSGSGGGWLQDLLNKML
ncbi:MAG: hypothetical protein O6852_09840 [Gammaproteobacteria bacterium]|nr:hypothetical protein [Gammaproteobacteria bacterium]